jgi:hypothetical protein
MNERATEHLKHLRRKYLIIRSGEILLVSLAVGILVYGAIIFVPTAEAARLTVGIASVFVTAAVRYHMLKLNQVDEHRVVAFINRQYPTLQQSSDLLLREDADLTSLQRLQKEKVLKEFAVVYPGIRFPHHVGQATLLFVTSLLIVTLLTSFIKKGTEGTDSHVPDSVSGRKEIPTKLPAIVKEISIKIQPPSYTEKPVFYSNNPNLIIQEGSIVQWKITFTDAVKKVHIVLSGNDMMKANAEGIFRQTFSKSSFYQFSWTLPDGETKTSDYYKIEVTADEPPDIVVHELQQFTQVTISDKLSFDLKSTLSDDYGVQDAYIIATVSKGSGESVKFREEKLKFTTPAVLHGKNIRASRTIDLVKLGLEPGDELYFYVEALDNKTPLANRARTETFFIALQDTASQQLSVEGGLGVDLMPEYFRSQRQIIIDSEKLLGDRKNISKHEFNSRSNELGYDQKVLRLKYGEFLGEEFESNIGPGSELPGEDHGDEGGEKEEEDPKEKYGHVHDKENEHNLVPEKHQQQGHTHDGELSLDPDKKENPADAYKHQHDDPEEATFFTQSIRSKLKAALTVMWDAELHLRMYDPEKSLPFQYTALKLLKEISNDSRIYVHKTGFDPPPLKEEKRLTGDLAEIKSSKLQASLRADAIFPKIKKALILLEGKIQSKTTAFLSAEEKQVLLGAGNELSSLALEQPGQFLKTLSEIKALNENEISADQIRQSFIAIRTSLWQAIPQQAMSPDQSTRADHALDREFVKKMDALKND